MQLMALGSPIECSACATVRMWQHSVFLLCQPPTLCNLHNANISCLSGAISHAAGRHMWRQVPLDAADHLARHSLLQPGRACCDHETPLKS